jgi:predicted DNA-binding transcriptional regulator AlpA
MHTTAHKARRRTSPDAGDQLLLALAEKADDRQRKALLTLMQEAEEQRKKVEQRLLAKAEVLERVGRTFPTLWLWMQQKKFPRARDLNGRPAWLESEVEDWIKALPVRRLKGDGDDHE